MKRWIPAVAFLVFISVPLAVQQVAGAAGGDPPVTLKQDQTTFTLDNGYVTAQISRASGDLVSLKYQKLEMLGGDATHVAARWRSAPAGGAPPSSSVTLDPAETSGQRAEVSIAGTLMVSADTKQPLVDSEVRYSLGRGDRGIYTYQSLRHLAGYAAFAVASGDFTLRLNAELFDRVSIDQNRDRLVPSAAEWNGGTPQQIPQARLIKTGRFAGQVECGFDNDAVLFDTRVYGWAGNSKRVGVWMVNPSTEYLQGGPGMIAPTVYRNEEDGAPMLVNHWCGDIRSENPAQYMLADENAVWSKVIGPIFILCNDGNRADAVAQGNREIAAWPYNWVKGVDYVPREKRSTVRGQIFYSDPQNDDPLTVRTVNVPGVTVARGGINRTITGVPITGVPITGRAAQVPEATPHHLIVGLASSRVAVGSLAQPWQREADGYQFWARSGNDVAFNIPNVPAGEYHLYAIEDGVLGQFLVQKVVVAPGRNIDLGNLTWTPQRYGITAFEIGYPDRTGGKFLHGNDVHHWGLWNLYARDFPRGLTYFDGRSNFRKDWNYQQPPGSTWRIVFNLPTLQAGEHGWLRIALAGGSENAKLRVYLNNIEITSNQNGLIGDENILHGENRGYWEERVYPTTPGSLKDGDNTIELRVEGSKPTDGIIYDYLRFEREDVPIRLVDQNGNSNYPNQSTNPTTRGSGLPPGTGNGGTPGGNGSQRTPVQHVPIQHTPIKREAPPPR